MLLLCLLVGICSTGVGLSSSMLGALLLFVSSFAFTSIIILIQGGLFIGLGYTVVYMGAIAVVFVFAVLAMDNQPVDDRTLSRGAWKQNLAFFAIGSGLCFGSIPKVLSLEDGDLGIETGDAVLGLGALLLNDGGVIVLLIGLVLLFAMVGPSLVWG